MINLHLFTLKQRIFLVKHFYQELGNYISVKSNYEDFYGYKEIPVLSMEILTEVIRLFEDTGSVLKNSDNSCLQEFEDVGIKENNVSGAVKEKQIKQVEGIRQEELTNEDNNVQEDIKDEEKSYSYKTSPQETDERPIQIFNENFSVTNILGTCSFCNQKYLKIELEKHIATHGKKKRHQERRIICEICGKFFANISRMEQHKIIHSTERSFTCDVEGCSKTFKWRNSYEKHKMRHKENISKDFSCDLCEKSFSYSYILRKHILDVHEQHQIIKCKWCVKTFSRKATFITHMKMHESPSNAEIDSRSIRSCDLCGKACLHIHFEKHMMSHRGERPLKCDICGKGFIWKCGLRKHLMAHRGLLPKSNLPICEICGKKMSKFQSLQAHMKIHERPEQPFKCPITGCEKSYTNERFLKRHVDRHASKRHKCNYCHIDYKDSQQLKIHVRKIHLKEDAPFKCDQCDKDSWTLRVHRQHMKTRHNVVIPFIRKKK